MIVASLTILSFSIVVAGRVEARRQYYEVDPSEYRGGQQRWMNPSSKKAIGAALGRMEQNGLLAAIDAKHGANSERGALMKAMAVRESDGVADAVNQTSRAACAYQIYPPNIEAWASQAGMSAAAYSQRLLSDRRFCLDAGDRALNEGGGMTDRALCQYAGEMKMYKKEGWCWASDEYKVIAAEINGGTVRMTNVDKESEKFATQVIKDSNGNKLAEVFVCHDHTEQLAKGLAKMADAFKVTGMISLRDTYYGNLRTNEWIDPEYNPDPWDSQCLGQIFDMYEMAQMQAGTYLWSFFKSQVLAVLEKVCDFVLSDALKYAYTGLTGIACIPWADFRFDIGMDFGGERKESCNGMTVLDAWAMMGGALTQEEAERGLGEHFESGTLPTVQGLPTLDLGGTRPWPLLRIRTRTQGGVNEYY